MRGIAVLLAAALIAAPALGETLSNGSIIALSQAGLGPEAIVAKIHASPGAYDLGTDQLIALKKAGVADAVIAAMLEASGDSGVSANALGASDSTDPRAPHAAGIYLLTPAKMVRMDATAGNQTKNSGLLGYAFTGGIAKMKIKTVLPNPTARVKATGVRPVFYFYFDQADASLSHGGFWLAGPGATVTSPSEFSLVRFEKTKSGREVVLGQFNIGGMKTGVMDKARVPFSYADVSPGVFRVTPDADLPPGEYGFVYSATATGTGVGFYGGGSMASRIFDFSVG